MSPINDILNDVVDTGSNEDARVLMQNPEYIRQSSAIISEALQKGFDVLQMENGDIVTTGTKIIVTQFKWDTKKGKMGKLSESEKKAAVKRVQDAAKDLED
jgi:Protein of unknown function (DUF2671)